MADVHHLSSFFFSSPRYNKWKTSTIKVTWTSVLKPKCTFNLNVILGSEVWQQIVRRNQFPHFTCSTQEIQKTSVLWYDSHLVKKGTKSMPVSVAFIEKQKHLCLLILLLLLKIKRSEPSFDVRKWNENKTCFFFWLLEVFILHLELLERCCLRLNISTPRRSISASYFTDRAVDGSPFGG